MRPTLVIALLWFIVSLASASVVKPDLVLPPVSNGLPGAGLKVAVSAPEYEGTGVHHMLYLPTDWTADWREKKRTWPVIVEYTGNKFPKAGSTGEVADAGLGFGISGGRFIWVVLPYVSVDHQHNENLWWGDTQATVDYAKKNIPRVCAEFGGDPGAVFLCGFSRGAIGVNYLGLYDGEVARLWRGFISHDHYDGLSEWKNTTWGSPLAQYRQGAVERLKRLNGRPVLVCHNAGDEPRTAALVDYLATNSSAAVFTFLKVDIKGIFCVFPNNLVPHPHTDRWLLVDSADRRMVWQWLDQTLQTSQPTQPR
jgi:hypothetical protein